MKSLIFSFFTMFLLMSSFVFGQITTENLVCLNLLRESAVKYDLSEYVADEVEVAEEYYFKAMVLIRDQTDLEEAAELLTMASNSYYIAVNTGYPLYIAELKESISLLKENVTSVNEMFYDEAESYSLRADNYIYNKEYGMAIESLINSKQIYSSTPVAKADDTTVVEKTDDTVTVVADDTTVVEETDDTVTVVTDTPEPDVVVIKVNDNIEAVKAEAKEYLDMLKLKDAINDESISRQYISAIYFYNNADYKYDDLMKKDLVGTDEALENKIYDEFEKSLLMAKAVLPLKIAFDNYNEVKPTNMLSEEQDANILKILGEAVSAFDQEDYELSESKSNEVPELIASAKDMFFSNKMYALAYASFDNAKKTDKNFIRTQLYIDTYAVLYNAQEALSTNDYDAVETYSMDTLRKLEKGGYAVPILPKYYLVRYIPGDWDSFVNIAEYEFIYNDRVLWTVLYEANKNKIPRINNPNLIYPGVVFEIPTISDEIREGNYDPKKKYLIFTDDNLPKPEYLEPLANN